MTQDSEADRVLGLVHGQVCYLQLPAANRERAATFYQAVFGWHIEAHYPDFEAPGLIGQWVEGRPPARDAGPMIWIHVADMAETLERVTATAAESSNLPPPMARPAPSPRSSTRKATPLAWLATRRRPDCAARRLARPEDSASGGTGAGK